MTRGTVAHSVSPCLRFLRGASCGFFFVVLVEVTVACTEAVGETPALREDLVFLVWLSTSRRAPAHCASAISRGSSADPHFGFFNAGESIFASCCMFRNAFLRIVIRHAEAEVLGLANGFAGGIDEPSFLPAFATGTGRRGVDREAVCEFDMDKFRVGFLHGFLLPSCRTSTCHASSFDIISESSCTRAAFRHGFRRRERCKEDDIVSILSS